MTISLTGFLLNFRDTTFFTAISRWRVVSRRALDASGFWQG